MMLSKRRKKETVEKVNDENIRHQLLINLAKFISTKDIHKYKLMEKTKTVLVTKGHIFRKRLIYSCPECEEGVVTPYSFFCPNCGTKLKWSKGAPHGD